MKLRIHYGITEKLRNYGKFTELRTGISDYGQNPKHYGFVPRVTPESLTNSIQNKNKYFTKNY